MTASDLRIQGYDAIEFWVGNAKQAAHFYRTALGFRPIGYAGPETGVADRASYLLQQGDVRFALTSGLRSDHEIVRHVARHGDGIRDVALQVPDAAAVFEHAVERGARPLREPELLRDERGTLVLASIAVYGDTIHSFVQRDDYAGIHGPGYEPVGPGDPADGPGPAVVESAGIESIDHVVANVERGEMDRWSAFYQEILGFEQLRHFDSETIATPDTALMSKVVSDGEGRVKLPINEPAPGAKRSQIEEYLEANDGPGVQHLALQTRDIVRTVRTLTERGTRFLDVPEEYYEGAEERVGEVEESWEDLAELGVLVDRDEEGYLLQIFTEPVQDRPTVFYEIIQRRGARGFGVGNFKALFEAVERAQARRGNL